MNKDVRSPGTGALRWLRAGAVAALTVALAVDAHVRAGGAPPHAVAALLLTGVAMIPAFVIGRRRLGRVHLLGILGAGQIAIHEILALGPPAQQPATHAGHAGHAAVVPHAPPTEGGAAMLVGHVLATILTALLLAYGEALLWALWSLWGLALRLRDLEWRLVLPVLAPDAHPLLVPLWRGPSLRSANGSRAPPAQPCPASG